MKLRSVLSVVCALVAHRSASQAQPPRGFVEEMRIVSDDANPAMRLTRPSDLIVNEQGLLFTAHGEEAIIRAFDASGKYLRSFGRRGQGPGEFGRGFGFLAAVADTVIVYNYVPWSLAFFRSNGTLVRSVAIVSKPEPGPMEPGRTTPRLATPLMNSFLPGNRALAHIIYYGGGRGNSREDSTVYWLTDVTGTLIKRLGIDSPTQPGWAGPTPAARGSATIATGGPQPAFGARVLGLADPSGGRGYILLPGPTWGGTHSQIKLLTVEREGIASERIIPFPPRRVTSRDVDEFIALAQLRREAIDSMRLAMSRGLGPAPAVMTADAYERQLRSELVIPEFAAPARFAIAGAGADGSMWINGTVDITDWTVINSAGVVLYKVRIPLRTLIKRVSVDRFWAVALDSDGLPIITRNRVAPR